MRPAAATALLGLLLTLIAATFDAEPLYVAGIGLMVLAGAAALWVTLAARGVRVERTVGARRTIEEQPVVIDLVVSSGRLPLPSGFIEDDLLPAPAAMVSGRRRTEVHISARFARRGRKLLPPPRIVVSDPMGLATRVVTADEPVELLVLPRLEKVVTPPGDGDGSGLAARRGRPSIAAEVDLDGLRPYRPGAAASRIFWPGLARGGELMERRLRSDGDTRPLIVLDPRRPAREEDLDAAVRFYRDAFDFKVALESPYWSELRWGDATIAVHGREATPSAETETGLGIEVDDLDAACQAVADAGGRVVNPPVERPGEGIRLATAAPASTASRCASACPARPRCWSW